MQQYSITTDEYCSNCLVEGLRAKLKNRGVKLYICRPRFHQGHFEMPHIMWSDGIADFDFSDLGTDHLPWYKCFWFSGAIREFPLGFARRYSKMRNYRRKSKTPKCVIDHLCVECNCEMQVELQDNISFSDVFQAKLDHPSWHNVTTDTLRRVVCPHCGTRNYVLINSCSEGEG